MSLTCFGKTAVIRVSLRILPMESIAQDHHSGYTPLEPLAPIDLP